MVLISLDRIESYFPICDESRDWFKDSWPEGQAPLKDVLRLCRIEWLEYVCEMLERRHNFQSISWIDLYRAYIDDELDFNEYNKQLVEALEEWIEIESLTWITERVLTQ